MVQALTTGRVRAGAGIVVAGIALTGPGMLSPSAHAAQDENEQLALFGQMMPVFTSPRCLNCHGGVNPVTGANHEGGAIAFTLEANGDMGFDEKKVCQECHTAGTANWRVAPKALAFVGKDTLALCRQMRSSNAGAGFVGHIANDDLIGLAFVGQGGIGDDSPFAPIAADPPPMSRDEMVTAAQQWVDAGAGCGTTWSGSISKETTSKTHVDTQPGTLITLDSAGDSIVTLTVADSQATAIVHVTSHDFRDGPPNRPCYILHDSFVADGNGDAGIQIAGDTGNSGTLFVTFSAPAANGTHHSEITTQPPACKPVLHDEKYSVQQSFSALQITLDPDNPDDPSDPNHIFGHQYVQELDGSMTTYIWDLSKS